MKDQSMCSVHILDQEQIHRSSFIPKYKTQNLSSKFLLLFLRSFDHNPKILRHSSYQEVWSMSPLLESEWAV